ncbi:FimB/Mfa2 family fimbrial subunit [Bacteroides sp. 519]|uniref:FimB/Mfa2 family fimbrial subunit n=1 Tax=Bacteroides sp. 519 TaxID=2302937 RepID=UPI0013D22C0B|nr:FimB/Mfa2 family fimbrial subunit [Bacteroides sp. 519]NDV56897.1 hypothetical protein [Bacteroides sp. 519]
MKTHLHSDKKNIMRTAVNKIIVYLLLLLPFLGSCIGEGDLDCDQSEFGSEQSLTLRFLHNINPDYSNTIRDVIDYIDLYLYKESGEFYQTVHLTKDELEETNYTYTTRLDPGTYRLATWMNAGEAYNIEDHEEIGTARMRVICNGERELSENTPAVFYGYDDKLYDIDYENQDVVFTISKHPVEKTINFAKNTNHIEVVAKFDRVLIEGTELDVRIVGPNGICNFVNRYVDTCPDYLYYPHTTTTQQHDLDPLFGYRYYYSHITNFTTQRLWQGDELELVITYTNYSGYPDELARFKLTDELIMQNPLYNNNYQLERYDNYRIVFYFDYDRAFTLTEITVNDWVLINQEQDL